MIEEILPHRFIIALKVKHLFWLLFAIVGVLLAFLLPIFGYVPEIQEDDDRILIIEILSSIFALISLIVALRSLIKHVSINRSTLFENEIKVLHFFSTSELSFSFIVGTGLIVALFGGHWFIWMTMFISAIIGLILTYPTDHRLDKWLNGAKDNIKDD